MHINIRKVFAEKNPKLAKLIPGFIYKYLENVIHQDLLNDFLSQTQLEGTKFLDYVLNKFGTKLVIKGAENLPVNGRCIFACNHPLGGLDGMLIINELNKHYGAGKAIVNDILMNVKNLENVFLPVNKHGALTKNYAYILNNAFESNIPILTFPAGFCSRKIKGEIIDLTWNRNFISKAISYNRPIVPLHITGKNSNFFYNLSNFRKKIRLKANIEMLYLVDEMLKQKGKTFAITIGKPINPELLKQHYTPKQWALKIQNYVHTILPFNNIDLELN